jgi:sigma-54 dependent transcriptional regulator, acetoin dehydrogenase operon transcriptional activator AcoR
VELNPMQLVEDAPLPMREEIFISWFRSARSGVRSDRLHVPYDPDVETDSRLMSAARPVLEAVAQDLTGTSVGVVLSDARGHILERRVPDRDVRSCFDRIELAPGFRYREGDVGTNAIGTALAVQRPFVVVGGEHFVDDLATMACAATLIRDPSSGDLLGVFDVSCRTEHASPLMMPFAKRAAGEIEQRLLDGASAADRALRDHFVQARRRSKDAVVSVSARTMLVNAAASGMLQRGDHDVLWEWVSRVVARQPLPAEIALSSGTWVVRSIEPCRDGGQLIGATLRLQTASSYATGRSRGGPLGAGDRPRFGWASLTATERRIAELVAEGKTNRQVAAQVYLSFHTVGFHLRQVFRKLEIGSRVELTRLVLQRTADHEASSPDLP